MAECISQFRMKQDDGTFIDVPCGRCGFCLQNRRKEWSFRLQKELRYHETAHFITLTCSDENLSFADHGGACVPCLYKPDWQNFMKRLRKRQKEVSDVKLKYYAVGEYGSKTHRPHYHAILYSLDPSLVDQVETIWGLGNTKVGTVTSNSIDYVTKYVVNKYDHSKYPVPPFACISNGIGLKHFEENEARYQRETVVRNDRGYKQKLPRYYRNRLNRNRITQDIMNAKRIEESDQKHSEEVYRLSRIGHEEPERYMEERQVYNSTRILQRAKTKNL